MSVSIDELLEYARRIYINKEKVEAIATELGVTARWMHSNIRRAFPRLISEEGWTIPEVVKNLRGREIPLEMRKEVQKLRKKHSQKEVEEMTGVSEASIVRWSNGNFGEHGIQTMGTLPWKSLIGPMVSKSKNKGKSRHNAAAVQAGVNRPDSVRRKAIYRLITGTDIQELSDELGVTETALYNWRSDLVGLTTAKKYEAICARFIAKVAAELGEEPKPLFIKRRAANPPIIERRAVKPKPKPKPKTRRQFTRDFKRSAVNRVVNHKESIADVARELEIKEATLYSFQRQIVGGTHSKSFVAKSRALAREFIEEAQVDDVVTHANGREPEPVFEVAALAVPAPRALSVEVEVLDTVGAKQPDAIMASLTILDRRLQAMQKDRQLLVQQLEIQKLRRELAQAGGSP